MNDRELLLLARNTLTVNELNVWVAKHYQGFGRRAGSKHLGISEEAYRHRLREAERKMGEALAEAA